MELLNIFMVVNFTPSDDSIGVTKKLKGTIDAFRKKGHAVFYTAYGENGIQVFDNNDQLIYEKKYLFKNEKLRAISRRFELLSVANSYLKNFEPKVDIAFLRWLGFDIPYIALLKTIKKRKKSHVIVDMHSYFPGIKFSNLKSKYMTFNTDLFHKIAAEQIDTFLTEGDLEYLWGKKTVHASIGISLDKLEKHVYVGDPEEINMISVAIERPYHGYDRLIKSLYEYNKAFPGARRINLHLVGTINDSTKKLVNDLGLENHVFLYGKKFGQELTDIYSLCNLGIGPVCQHRVGGKKGTGLKTKEYFGIGIPYFYAGEEVCVPQNYPYVMEIPDDESLVDMHAVEEFYLSYKDNKNVAQEMREYAARNYSWDSITDDFLKPYYAKKGDF